MIEAIKIYLKSFFERDRRCMTNHDKSKHVATPAPPRQHCAWAVSWKEFPPHQNHQDPEEAGRYLNHENMSAKKNSGFPSCVT